MRRLILTSLLLATSFIPLSASNSYAATGATASPGLVHRSYGTHYDGSRVQHGRGRPRIGTALTGDLPNFRITFHGGPVQTATVSYAIYWQPPGKYMSPTYKPLINRFLGDVCGSAIYDMATTYSGSNGRVRNASIFGGS